jgi:phosphatidylserine/phosphatidylglycerophosphate/cardiolipin synthase-like enzyme
MKFLAVLAGLALLFGGCAGLPQPTLTTAQQEDLLARGPHQVALLDIGFDALVQRVALIRSARQRIDVQTFIYADDATGRFLLDELAAAADRGVRVRLLVDWMFCAVPPARLAELRRTHPGLAIALYNPRPGAVVEARRELQTEVDAGLNHRMHNKLLVVDASVGITGGRNHEDTYFDVHPGLNYRDREVLVRGPVARQMAACAAAWWFHPLVVPVEELAAAAAAPAAPRPLDDVDRRVALLRAAVERRLTAGAPLDCCEVQQVAFCWDVPGRPESAEASSTVAGLGTALAGTTRSLDIVSPYCVLNSANFASLCRLRDRGVAIDILTNSLASTDAWWAFGGYLRDRRRLVAAGITLGESRPRPAALPLMWETGDDVVALRSGGDEPFLSLHAKCLLSDEEIAVVGTFNLDPRSRHTNTEQVLIVWDAPFSRKLAALMRSDADPGNAWRVGKRPLLLGWFHTPFIRLSEWTGDWLSLDVYPVQSTTCFDLVPGARPTPNSVPGAGATWSDAGPTPEAETGAANLAAMVQRFGAVLTPLL